MLNDALTPLDLSPVLVTLGIGWLVMDDHAVVSKRYCHSLSKHYYDICYSQILMNVVKEEITVLSNALTPLDLTPVLVTLGIVWLVMDDHAVVSKRYCHSLSKHYYDICYSQILMNVVKEEITVLSNALTPLDLTPVLVTPGIGWLVVDDHAVVSKK